MKLILSADTVAFLAKGPPRAWVKRMVLWMIYDGELKPYFGRGKIVPYAQVYSILMSVEGFTFSIPTAERDALIRFAMGHNVQSSRLSQL